MSIQSQLRDKRIIHILGLLGAGSSYDIRAETGLRPRAIQASLRRLYRDGHVSRSAGWVNGRQGWLYESAE